MSSIYHVIYKWTNKINGKYYIGKHSTDDPWRDDYKGSGKPVWEDAKKKYGIENFAREILYFCDTEDEAYDKEHELVGLNEVKNPMCYNQKVGGKGARSGEENTFYGRKHHEESRIMISKNHAKPWLNEKHSEKTKQKQSEAAQGKKKSKIHCLNISKARKGVFVGERNSTSKLKNKDVLLVRKLYNGKKYTQKELGKLFGVQQACIHKIVNNLTWKHI